MTKQSRIAPDCPLCGQPIPKHKKGGNFLAASSKGLGGGLYHSGDGGFPDCFTKAWEAKKAEAKYSA